MKLGNKLWDLQSLTLLWAPAQHPALSVLLSAGNLPLRDYSRWLLLEGNHNFGHLSSLQKDLLLVSEIYRCWVLLSDKSLKGKFKEQPHKAVSWMSQKLRKALNEDRDWVIPRAIAAPFFFPSFMKLVYIWRNRESVTYFKMYMAQKEGLEGFWIFADRLH